MAARFQDLETFETSDAEAAMARDVPDELLYVPLAVSLSAPDMAWAQSVCVQLASHPHPNVRGNALLGFGHLGRRFPELNRSVVQPIVERGLTDTDAWVRGQSISAADDLRHYLGWCIGAPEA